MHRHHPLPHTEGTPYTKGTPYTRGTSTPRGPLPRGGPQADINSCSPSVPVQDELNIIITCSLWVF